MESRNKKRAGDSNSRKSNKKTKADDTADGSSSSRRRSERLSRTTNTESEHAARVSKMKLNILTLSKIVM